jgi:hypothetical protein
MIVLCAEEVRRGRTGATIPAAGRNNYLEREATLVRESLSEEGVSVLF